MSSIRRLGRAWHWKAAILSAICRAGVFFGTNVPEGGWAAATCPCR